MKYNKKKEGTPTVITLQGGTGFQQSPEIALLSLMATGIDKTFYEGSDDREKRLVELVNQVAKKDPYFAAQCIVYARSIYGQRTVTHRAAVALAPFIAGEEWAKRFFGRGRLKSFKGGVICRLDDMLEIAACYMHFNKNEKGKPKRMPNAMTKGFAQVIHDADAFELARYQGNGKDIGLVDIINLVRPRTRKENKEVMDQLMTGKLKQFGTSESMNSESGREVADLVTAGVITIGEKSEALAALTAKNFSDLMDSGIGYLQLLRNLRNIVAADATLVDKAGKLLTNKEKIVKSLVYPHQIDLALELLIEEVKGSVGRKLTDYLDEAYEISTENVHALGIDEHTAVVMDTSGSMHGNSGMRIDGKSVPNRLPIEKAALIGATLAKGVKADVYQFASWAKGIPYNHRDSINTIKKGFMSHQGECDHGTMMDSIFQLFNKLGVTYNRIFLISDLQLADNVVKAGSEYKKYVQRADEPYIYAIDLVGYGNQPLRQSGRYFNLAGYSAQIYETAKKYEVDPHALINEVKSIEI